jgi:hypothetical protein
MNLSRYASVKRVLAAAILLAVAVPCSAQITPAAASVPPDDTPSIKVGATIFADYTVQSTPKIKDADGNEVTSNAFNVGRTYINITGNISHNIAFRITPDITRETESATAATSVAGNYIFRLKYGFVQFNLDDHLNPGRAGSWLRFGLQQTPWVEYMENVYRYRFQGQVFAEREGFLSSSDLGASFHYSFAHNYGEVHSGFYNGETYTKPEVNDQKAFMIRATLRPLPKSEALRGLRISGFYDHDAYVKNADRTRGIFGLTYEHRYVNASWEYLIARDQNASAAKTAVDANGYSFWITPRTPKGWEGLLRYDHLAVNTNVAGAGIRTRWIGGVAYWFPHQGSVSTSLLLDVDQANFDEYAAAQPPTNTKYAIHALVNF